MLSIPIRMCVSCRKRAPRNAFVRVGKDPMGRIGVDLGGRGVYICRTAECVEKAIRGKLLAKPLRIDSSSVDWFKLAEELFWVVSNNSNAKI